MSGPAVRSTRGRARSRGRGQSLVEFALILPVFLLILAGILDFGFMLNTRITLINGTREAARWAVTQGDVLTIPPDFNNAGGHLAVNLPGMKWSDVSFTAACISSSGGNCDFVAGGQPNAVQGDMIRLSTHYVYHSFFASFFNSTVDLSTQVQMVLEVPT